MQEIARQVVVWFTWMEISLRLTAAVGSMNLGSQEPRGPWRPQMMQETARLAVPRLTWMEIYL